MLVKPQQENAQYSMLVTLSGIVMLVKLLQFSNADSPMLVTLSGIVMLIKPQPENAAVPMLVTPSSITTFLTFELLYTGLRLLS